MKSLNPKKEDLLLWFCFFALLFGPAFALFSEYSYNLEANPDILSYLKLAELDFNDSPVRRYRFIIPFLSGGLHILLTPLKTIQPWDFPGPNFTLGLSFLIVNCSIMALSCLVLLKWLRVQGLNFWIALIAPLLVLGSRWTPYFAGLPLVDSLYFLVICSFLYAFATGNKRLFILCLLLGPIAKESFVLFIPLFFLFCPLSLIQLCFWLMISGLFNFSLRYGIDLMAGLDPLESYVADGNHIQHIPGSLTRLFSFHGLYELWSVAGFFNLLLALALIKKYRSKFPAFRWDIMVFIGIIFSHAILSGELARMLYLLLPIFAYYMSFILSSLFEVEITRPSDSLEF
ncbi:hypothetical protein [Luteibaculum oceani]|uniref:DUF2029 domain-containing protein n=1 Tax=Luteibaculum oceani TaxID=1294296 RepID=A0A5C6UU10_9FLAO|nr:hypothetical protein [Luteibaculum oceani]TXC76080.1 hypothetical protein FRX97_11240 [Luteibaculum oceani]